MESTERFIEKRLRLKTNRNKSAVAKPEKRHFLGFKLESNLEQGIVEVKLSERSRERINAKIKELTPRNWGQSVEDCIEGLNSYLNGWIEFFKICTKPEERTLCVLDAHIRRIDSGTLDLASGITASVVALDAPGGGAPFSLKVLGDNR